MTANRTHRWTHSSGRRWLRSAVLAVVTALAIPLLASPALADPVPTTAAQARDMVKQAAQQLSVLDEQLQQATIALAAKQKAAADATARAVQAQHALDAYDPQLRAIAQSGITGPSQSRLAAFLTSTSADQLMQQLTTIDLIASHTEQVIAQVAVAQDKAKAAKAAADQATAQAQAGFDALKQQKTDLENKAADYRLQFARLTTAEQAQVTTAVAGRSLAVPSVTALTANASEAAAIVIKTALAQVGKPYVWGAAGPKGFDCSGLVDFAFAAIGMDLPHSSGALSQMGTQVSRANLQPGDVVYFYTPVSHVGIYIGDGMMVHARTFGIPVGVTSVDQSGYRGAVRLIH